MADPTAKRPLALITGASGGIGEALARLFAAGGYDLALVARREEKLRALGAALASAHGLRAHVLPADLSDASATRALVDRLERDGLAVDVLVNNAGFAVGGPFAETPENAEMDMLRVNVVALVQLSKLLLPGMVARRSGKILNVASTAAFVPGPLMAGYYASKAYVLSLSEALAVETEGTGVTVTVLCPGPTATGFAEVAGVGHSGLFSGGGVMGVDEVARAAYDGLMAGKRVVIPGARNRALAFSSRLAPRRVLAMIARNLNQSAGG